MLVAVDETGYFRDQSGEKIGLVTLVTVTDSEWSKFSSFIKKIIPSGVAGVKGRNLTREQRIKVLKYLGKKTEIRYTTFLYDLSSGADQWVKWHRDETIRKLESSVERMKDKLFPSYKKDIELLRNQLRKLSLGDYAKFVMYTELLIAWQQYFLFDYFYTHIGNDNWKMHHVLDMQNEPQKFLRLVRSFMILTVNEQNPNYRIYTPAEWGKDHPFIIKHSMEGDINKQNGHIFYEDFRIGNEQTDTCLFLPDLVGYIIYTSILKRNQKEWLKSLKRIRQNRSYTITTKHKDGYYHITGFDRAKNPYQVNKIIKEHWKLMKNI